MLEIDSKNRIMTYLTAGTVILSLIVHILHRQFLLFGDYLTLNNIQVGQTDTVLNILLLIPILSFAFTIFIQFSRKSWRRHIPFLNMTTLTFASISIIAGGNGMVEYHFSIFMVIAMLAYYESIKLVLISTILFALHHLVGYFTLPEIICGTSQYPFGLLLVHAVFLILTSGSTILQIVHKLKFMKGVEEERQEKKKQFDSLLAKLQSTSQTVINTTRVLMDNITKSKQSSQEISNVINEIASGSENQAQSTQDASRAMSEMASGIQKIAESASVVAERSQSTVSEVKKGDSSIQQTMAQMDSIHRSVNSIARTIENLDDKSKEIGRILQVITDITEQTNLLALNAAIEAARAGEHGKGFAVVADEVRKLAEQSNASAGEISQIIEDIQVGTDEAKQAMNQGIIEVDNGIQNVKQTGDVLKSILAYAEEVAAQIEEISAISQQMSASSEEISASVDEMSTIAKTSNEQSKSVVTFTDEQMASIEEIKHVSESLQNMSYELEELVKKFSQE
ncbi:MAG: methyl-accepting chemotaxis protein [Bacillaceae bacterium]|nr:methyl-accepting chemotaxis protein [Bacillaceae bacterium]